MSLINLIKEINSQKELKIVSCQQVVNAGNCNWDCCVYTNSYCLMLPGEYEAALQLGYRVDGYTVVDEDYFGGKKVVPKTMKCCVGPEMPPNHYKTLDCWFYPVWPFIEKNEINMIIGSLCPLRAAALPEVKQHACTIERYTKTLIKDLKIKHFLMEAKMVGYQKLEYKL